MRGIELAVPSPFHVYNKILYGHNVMHAYIIASLLAIVNDMQLLQDVEST